MAVKLPHPACTIREGSWIDFRDDVKKVDAELYEIIEQISPNQKYKLIEATYLYGEKITDLGTICLPDKDGRLHRLDDSRLPDKYREELSYGPTPLILQLTNGSEVFLEAGERIIPLNVFTPGDLYGLFEAIMPMTGCPIAPCWSVTSGARSVFLGAKVTDAIGHKKLRAEYGVSSEPPKKLSDQWHIIKTIGYRSNLNSPWTCKVLIFTKDWLEDRDDDIGWLRFHKYLLKKSWIQSKNTRVKTEYSIMWESFASAIRARNLKPGPYIVDTIMHLLFLANRAVPGFKPADTSQLMLPSLAVEYAYQHIYQLKEYAAIVMQPYVLGARGDVSSAYYSISYPTLLEGTPAIRRAPSIISEIRDIKTLMNTLERILESHDSHIYKFIKSAMFDYFHNEEDRFQEIAHSKDILEGDQNLADCLSRFEVKTFPYKGPFFRGCIRISNKNF